MNLIKLWFLEFLNILRPYFQMNEYLFVLLKECPMVIQASVFQTRISLITVNYLVDNFFENVDVPYSKVEWVVS